MASQDHRRAFLPPKHRKIILATNVEETSITVAGINLATGMAFCLFSSTIHASLSISVPVAAGEDGGEAEELVPEERGLLQHHGDGCGYAQPGAGSVEGQCILGGLAVKVTSKTSKQKVTTEGWSRLARCLVSTQTWAGWTESCNGGLEGQH